MLGKLLKFRRRSLSPYADDKAVTDFERVAKDQGLDLDYDRPNRIREITELPAEEIGGSIDELARLLGQTDPNKGKW